MPELGKYAFTVLTSYGVTLALILGLVALTVWRGAQVRRALEAQERRMSGNG